MKKYALMVSLAVCAISACTIGARAQADTMASVASLSITSGSPAATPNPVLTGQPSIVNFNVTLSVSGSGAELTGNDVSSQIYTISAGSGPDPNDNIVESVSAPGFTVTIASDGHSATLTSSASGDSQTPSVSASVQYTTPGQKTITMSGSATFADGSSVSANPSGSVSLNVVQVSLSSSMHPTYVHLKGNYIDAFSTLNCQAQITPAVAGSTQSFSVTLTNPQHEVEFAAGTSDSITLSLAADGTAQPFDITGVAPSGTVGEAVIQASSPPGSVVATMPTTVFSFNSPSMTDTPGGDYLLFYTPGDVSEWYGPDNNPAPQNVAVHMTAQLTLQPVGLDVSAPQISSFKLGVQQNLDNPSSEEDTLAPPTVNDPSHQWLPGSVVGVTYRIPTLISLSTGKNYEVDDNDENNIQNPLYDPPVPFVANIPTVDNEYDAPSSEQDTGYFDQILYDSNNHPVVDARYYKISSAHYQEKFHDWAVLCQSNGTTLISRTNVAETTWGINVESDLANQHALVGTSGPVTTTPVDSPTANLSDTSNDSFGPTTYPITRTE